MQRFQIVERSVHPFYFAQIHSTQDNEKKQAKTVCMECSNYTKNNKHIELIYF